LLTDFAIFSDTGTYMAGASLYYGNIGSNMLVEVGASETQILGSVYSGGTLGLRSPGTVGSDGNISDFPLEPPLGNTKVIHDPLNVQVIANGAASIENNTKIWGTFDADSLATGTPTVSGAMRIAADGDTPDTFGTVTMQTASTFSAGTTDIDCQPNCGGATPNETVITAGTYRDLTVGQGTDSNGITLTLEGGTGNEFVFNSIDTSGNTRLNIDLSNGEVNIKSVGDISFGQDAQIWVQESAGSGYVRLDTVPHLADQINWETKRKFILGGGDVNEFSTIFGGNIFSSWLGTGNGVTFGQHLDFYGTIYALDDIDLADHSRYNYTPNAVPVPAAVWLFGSGLLGLVGIARRGKIS
jgi:archaellum component FlaG (FlaF/FlaG flagellin family)